MTPFHVLVQLNLGSSSKRITKFPLCWLKGTDFSLFGRHKSSFSFEAAGRQSTTCRGKLQSNVYKIWKRLVINQALFYLFSSVCVTADTCRLHLFQASLLVDQLHWWKRDMVHTVVLKWNEKYQYERTWPKKWLVSGFQHKLQYVSSLVFITAVLLFSKPFNSVSLFSSTFEDKKKGQFHSLYRVIKL